ncbi:MAG: NnrS family protein [Alphaproteobacteria bacterium]|nr:MAG: NnrS family protein [Alphaproteobacteria bacterium]
MPEERTMNQNAGPMRRFSADDAARLFFSAGFLLAALIGGLRALEGMGEIAALAYPVRWHGHEMLLGFAPALIAGYLVAARAPHLALLLFAGWLAARLALPASLILDTGWPMLLSPLFTLALALIAGAPFRRKEMRASNRIFALVLLIFPLADIIHLGGVWIGRPAMEPAGLLLAADGLLAMLFLMGGRILAATANGLAQRRGMRIDMRRATLHERLGVGLLIGLFVLDGLDAPDAARGLVAAMAAGMVFVRLYHFRILGQLIRPGVWKNPGGDHAAALLTLGYVWIAIGLFSRAIIGDLYWLTSPLVALHPAWIGGLGTLSATISLRSRHRRMAGSSHLPLSMAWPVLLFTPAALARMLAIPDLPARAGWLLVAGSVWVFACLWVAILHAGRIGSSTGSPRD